MSSKGGVLALQYEPVINRPEKNFEKIESLISLYNDKRLDIVVLPEFFSTGISFGGFAEFAQGETDSRVLDFVSELAKKYNTNICAGTVAEKEGDKFYNTSYLIGRNGEIKGKYRKIHLFSCEEGGEDKFFSEGKETVVIETDFAKIGLSICFDMEFPLLYKDLVKKGAELILCPNALCVSMKESKRLYEIKKEEVKACAILRASENFVYFAAASLKGKLGSGLISCGDSLIVSPEAEIITIANKDNDTVFAEIDLDLVRKYKESSVCKID